MHKKRIFILIAIFLVGFLFFYFFAVEKIKNKSESKNDAESKKENATEVEDDTGLYVQAFNKLDETICEKIQDEIVKESCILVVKDGKEYQKTLEKKSTSQTELPPSMEISDYEKIREENPNDLQNLVNLAKAYAFQLSLAKGSGEINKDEVNKAFGVINDAKKIDSKVAEIYAAEGFLYALNDQNDQAIESYAKCIEIDPKNIEALLSRGKIYAHINESNKAIADFEKIIEIDTGKYFSNNLVSVELCKLYIPETNIKEKKKNMCSVALENTKDEKLKSEIKKILDSI